MLRRRSEVLDGGVDLLKLYTGNYATASARPQLPGPSAARRIQHQRERASAGFLMVVPVIAQLGGLNKAIGKAQKAKEDTDKLKGLHINEKDERKIGENISAALIDRFGVYQDSSVTKYVSLVGSVLAQAGSLGLGRVGSGGSHKHPKLQFFNCMRIMNSTVKIVPSPQTARE